MSKRTHDYRMALMLAMIYHKDQVDLSGQPYISHPLRVVEYVKEALGRTSYHEQIIAILHDVVEDTECTLDMLGRFFDESTVHAIDAITKRDDETNRQYLNRVVNNYPASRVKLCDTKDNLSPDRMARLDHDKRIGLLCKYKKSLEVMITASRNHVFRTEAQKLLDTIEIPFKPTEEVRE